MEGEPAEFRCEATGNPPPRVEWIRVYGPMSPGVVVNNGILLLRSASRYDAAEYKCVARNNVGVDERTVILHVEGTVDCHSILVSLPCKMFSRDLCFCI